MSIWKTPSVADQPTIELVRWQILETQAGQFHFIGYDVGNAWGRASTAIREFNRATLTGITSSGRRYQLRGEPGMDRDALYVWSVWSVANGIPGARDVSLEVLAGEKLYGTR